MLDTSVPFNLAGYHVEPSILRVTRAGEIAKLEPRVMQVLVYLVAHADRVVSRGELEEHLWPGRIVTEDAVTNAIVKLRRTFGDDAYHPQVIETVPRTGYRLIAQLETFSEAEAQNRTPVIPAKYTGAREWRPGIPLLASMFLVLLLFVGAWWLLGGGETQTDHAVTLSGKPTVAILPFENLAASTGQDYFVNGITMELITDLSKVSGLLVIAPGSVFSYRDSETGLKKVSAELNVEYVVLGSVQRSGSQLRIHVQLIEANIERVLWGERYEVALNDIFEVQDKLSAAVITALEIELHPAERTILTKRPTASLAAYDYYLRGVEDHGHRSKEQNQSARDYFQRAIELDPSFARAYAGLALTYSRDAIDGWTSNPAQSLKQAADLAVKAAQMDPSLPQVHFVHGQINLFRRRYVQAIETTEKAIQVGPNYADAYALRAWILNYAGRPNKALTSMEKAMRLNPRPTSSYLEVLGEIRFVQGQYEEAVALFERVLNINPNYMRARMWNAAILAHMGLTDRAEWEATELLLLNPDLTLTRLEFAFPFKDPRILDALTNGLRKVGLTE